MINESTSQSCYHYYCLYCDNKCEFKIKNEFIKHLKQKHCSINGDSYKCLYGKNGNCTATTSEHQNLSNGSIGSGGGSSANSFTQKEYDEHVLNQHVKTLKTTSSSSSITTINQNDHNNDSNSSPLKSYSSTSMQFQSNLSAVLNDPRKDRVKVNQIFTKTWGYDFTDNPQYTELQLKLLPNISISDFKNYIAQTSNLYKTHLNHSQINNNVISTTTTKIETQATDLDQIPKIFFDQKFALTNKEMFNTVFNWNYFDINKKKELNQKQHRKILLEKLSHYLDLTELQISKQISTKANSFFHAMTSHDEIQDHIMKTCTAVKNIRKNVHDIDENVVIKSVKLLQLINRRNNYAKLVEKLELISSVHQTQRTIQLQLSTSEFTGSLDLISISQEYLERNLSGVHSMRHYSSQLNEIEKFINEMLHDEYNKYIDNDLSRAFVDGDDLYDKDKLTSLLFALLRIKQSPFINSLKTEITIYIKSAIKQTVIEYISQVDDQFHDENSSSLLQHVKQLGFQEFLHLLSRVLGNVRIMLGRAKNICEVAQKAIVLAAGHDVNGSENINYSNVQKELISETEYIQKSTALKELLVTSTEYAEERLVKLVDIKSKDNMIDKLNTNDFISLSHLLEQFIIDFDAISDKKIATLRSWLQSQGTKYLSKLHEDKKERLTIALDNERWKVQGVTAEIQALVDHIVAHGLSLPNRPEIKNHKMNDYLLVNNEKYMVVNSVFILIKIMSEYCQFTIDTPQLAFDVMHRLIEIFRIYNSRTGQLILGAGALQMVGLKSITIQHLALTYRCLELVLYFLPIVKEFFISKIEEKSVNSSSKQFDQLITDYNEHKNELYKKLLNIVDEVFKEYIDKYEVIAPVPSHCFRIICQRLSKVHELIVDVLVTDTIVKLFTKIHELFKIRLSARLQQLNIVNDGGPKHALIFSDMSYYIKQFKNLNGLHLISLNFEDVWTINNSPT